VWVFYVAALLGLAALVWGPARRAARRAPAALWACPILMFVSCVPFAGSTRYRSPADPFLLILVAVLLGVVVDRRRGERVASA